MSTRKTRAGQPHGQGTGVPLVSQWLGMIVGVARRSSAKLAAWLWAISHSIAHCPHSGPGAATTIGEAPQSRQRLGRRVRNRGEGCKRPASA
jgi:hypothetical protein